jgi:hypothetical protein
MLKEQLVEAESSWMCLLVVALPSLEGYVPKTVFVGVSGFPSFKEIAFFIDNTAAPLMKLSYANDQSDPSILLNAYPVSKEALDSYGVQYCCVNVNDIRILM